MIKKELTDIIDEMLEITFNINEGVEEKLNIVLPYLRTLVSMDLDLAQHKYNVLNFLMIIGYDVRTGNNFKNVKLYNQLIMPELYRKVKPKDL